MNLSFDLGVLAKGIDLAQKIAENQSKFDATAQLKRDGALGFAKLPYQSDEDLADLKKLASEVREEFKCVIVVGIGGSDLGARAVHRALNHQFYNLRETPRLFFLGDTTDPVAIREVLDVVDLQETAVIVISKSGNTVEQMSTFVYLRQLLLEAVGEERSRKHLIILTDAEKGTLREIVELEGYRSLPVPGDVGGRFSVLTNVGLFPLAIAGIDIDLLLAGAKAMDEYDTKQAATENELFHYALLQIEHYQHGRPISVLMPYSYGLREVGFWFRQLWAESLGKKVDLQGSVVHVGPTPIAAVGPTDQHSQVQLYMEGPADKVFTFITVQEPKVNMTLPESYADKEGVAYLKGHSFNEILLAEQRATAHALEEEGRPSCTITLPVLTAKEVGELLYFFEMATAYAGALLDINTYDQPGVEIGKQYMYGLMGRPGYEEYKF
jgi:glucose-6-phosphate isomerase